MHPDLEQAIAFHDSIVAEGGKALVGYDTAKALANVVLMSEIPTSYDKKEQRQVNAGNLLLRGVPGVGKTFFGVILAAISNAKFVRLQGRADLQPTEVVGFQMINPATGELMTEFGPLAQAEVILLDEINRIPLKSQSAFLEALQDRTVTVGKTTYELPAFSFAIATMNPVEHGVDLGASPRAIICWGRLAKVWALLVRHRTEVYPEDIQDLAQYILSHRIWLGPHAASHGLTTDSVINDVIERVAIP